MRFACPKCPNVIELREGVCSNCGFSLTLKSMVGHYWSQCRELWKNVRRRFQKKALVQCPGCGQAVPITANTCPDPACGVALSVQSTVNKATARPRKRWRIFLIQATPAAKRIVQGLYLLLSAAGLWWLLAYAEKNKTQGWWSLAAMSVVYLAGLTLLAKMIFPRQLFQVLVQRASAMVKLGLVCNYFSLLLLLQIAIAAWWARAMLLAGLLGVTWASLWLFRNVLSPMIYGDESPRWFDPSAPQGRTGRYD